MMNSKLLFSTWLEEASAKFGDKPAITCGDTISYRLLNERTQRTAQQLLRMGVQKGDRVVLWAVNGIDWVVSFLGITLAGGVAVLMNYGLGAEDVTQLTQMVGANWMIIGGNKVSAVDPAEAAKAGVLGGVPKAHIAPISMLYKTGMNTDDPIDEALLKAREDLLQPADTSVIIFTTGTTALPKAVQLSARSILSDALSGIELLRKDLSSSICVGLPLFHSFGLTAAVLYLTEGHHIFLVRDIKPNIIMDLMVENGIEDLSSVGAIFGVLPQLPGFEQKLYGKVKCCIVGGGFTTPTEMMRLENAFGGVQSCLTATVKRSALRLLHPPRHQIPLNAAR